MALIELADSPLMNCCRLVICLDRTLAPEELNSLVRDLGWVGFTAVTLKEWAAGKDVISPRWLFLAMDI